MTTTRQQDSARHRGDFKAINHRATLAQGNAQFWDTLPKPTAADVTAVRNAGIEVDALRTVTGNDQALMRKIDARRYETKRAQIVGDAWREDLPLSGSMSFRIGARGPVREPSMFEKEYQRLAGNPVPGLERKQALVGFAKGLQLKAANGMGEFAGYLSTFNHVDLGDDTVLPGAYADTIAAAKQKRAMMGNRYLWPILWQHQENMPIGGFTDAKEDSNGLFVVGEIDLETRNGSDAWKALSRGYVQGLSIGYNVGEHYYQGNTRMLQKIHLAEGSLVTFPMDTHAGVRSISQQ